MYDYTNIGNDRQQNLLAEANESRKKGKKASKNSAKPKFFMTLWLTLTNWLR